MVLAERPRQARQDDVLHLGDEVVLCGLPVPDECGNAYHEKEERHKRKGAVKGRARRQGGPIYYQARRCYYFFSKTPE